MAWILMPVLLQLYAVALAVRISVIGRRISKTSVSNHNYSSGTTRSVIKKNNTVLHNCETLKVPPAA